MDVFVDPVCGDDSDPAKPYKTLQAALEETMSNKDEKLIFKCASDPEDTSVGAYANEAGGLVIVATDDGAWTDDDFPTTNEVTVFLSREDALKLAAGINALLG